MVVTGQHNEESGPKTMAMNEHRDMHTCQTKGQSSPHMAEEGSRWGAESCGNSHFSHDKFPNDRRQPLKKRTQGSAGIYKL